jgi:hypothetical protein
MEFGEGADVGAADCEESSGIALKLDAEGGAVLTRKAVGAGSRTLSDDSSQSSRLLPIAIVSNLVA